MLWGSLRIQSLCVTGICCSLTKSYEITRANRNRLGQNFGWIRRLRWHPPLETLAPSAKWAQNGDKETAFSGFFVNKTMQRFNCFNPKGRFPGNLNTKCELVWSSILWGQKCKNFRWCSFAHSSVHAAPLAVLGIQWISALCLMSKAKSISSS